jgi:hypothetical protein
MPYIYSKAGASNERLHLSRLLRCAQCPAELRNCPANVTLTLPFLPFPLKDRLHLTSSSLQVAAVGIQLYT